MAAGSSSGASSYQRYPFGVEVIEAQTYIRSKRFRVVHVIQRFPLLFLGGLALVPRLYNLGVSTIGVHAWRQADTAAMARNFYVRSQQTYGLSSLSQYLYPQVDWGGGGYAETEFPIYPAIVSWIYRFTGDHPAYARLVTLLFSLLGLYFLYRLIELCFDRSVAFWSALFYAISPVSVFYGRTIQPESLVMMSTIGALYFFQRWLNEEKSLDLVISWGLGAIAFLTKVLPLVYLGIPLLFLAIVKYKWRIFRRLELWIYASTLLAVTFAWYYHAHQIYLDTGLTFGFWSDDTDRYTWIDLLSVKYWGDILLRLAVRHFAVFGFVVALVGLTYKRRQAADYLWEVGLVSSLMANAIAPTSSYVHEYYQLPVMLYGLVFIGKVYGRAISLEPSAARIDSGRPDSGRPDNGRKSRRSRPWLIAALILTFIASSAIYTLDYMRPENAEASKAYQLAQQIQAQTPPDAKVLAVTGGDPSLLYLADRKGWLIQPTEVSAQRLEAASADGAEFIVGSYEIIQSYAPFEDESQKANIRDVLSGQCTPLINNETIFISPLPCAAQ